MRPFALALAAIAAAGCASRPPAPLPEQPWMSLQEYAARGVESRGPAPVVGVPEGATLRLRITSTPCPNRHGVSLERELFTPVGEIVLTVQARKPFDLDLARLFVSSDRKTWGPLWLETGLFTHRLSELTIAHDAGSATVPGEAAFFVALEPAR